MRHGKGRLTRRELIKRFGILAFALTPVAPVRLGRGLGRGADAGRARLTRPLRLRRRRRGAQPAIRLRCADANGAIPSATYSRSST